MAWARARRPKRCKLANNPRIRQAVASKLRSNWSPEQIAGWLFQKEMFSEAFLGQGTRQRAKAKLGHYRPFRCWAGLDRCSTTLGRATIVRPHHCDCRLRLSFRSWVSSMIWSPDNVPEPDFNRAAAIIEILVHCFHKPPRGRTQPCGLTDEFQLRPWPQITPYHCSNACSSVRKRGLVRTNGVVASHRPDVVQPALRLRHELMTAHLSFQQRSYASSTTCTFKQRPIWKPHLNIVDFRAGRDEVRITGTDSTGAVMRRQHSDRKRHSVVLYASAESERIDLK